MSRTARSALADYPISLQQAARAVFGKRVAKPTIVAGLSDLRGDAHRLGASALAPGQPSARIAEELLGVLEVRT